MTGTSEAERTYHRDYIRVWVKKNPMRVLRIEWKRKGMNPDEAQRMYESKSSCDICGTSVEGKKKHVDHNHKTGQVRGILCDKCNLGIGLFNENPEILINATSYLSGVI